MKKITLSMLAAMVVLLSAVAVGRTEEEPKPLVTVSVTSYDKLLADIGLLGKLGANPGLVAQLEAMTAILPQGEKSKTPLAMDKKQPWGAVVLSGEPTPNFYTFLPLGEIEPLMDMVRTQTGQDVSMENDVYEIPSAGKTIYATQKGAWAFLTDAKDLLDKAPTDPASLLGDLPKRYDVAVLAAVKNLPKKQREEIVAMLQARAAIGTQRMDGENDEDYALRTNIAKQGVERFITLVNDLDSVMLGWNIDAKTKTTYLDGELTAQPGTKLADQLAQVKPGKSRFAGLLLPGAAVAAHSISTMSDNDVVQAKAALVNLQKSAAKEMERHGMSAEDTKLISQLLSDVFDVLQKTIDGKKTDSALSIALEPGTSRLVAGAAIADGTKLQASLQKLVDQYKGSKETEETLKTSTDKHEGVAIYAVSMPNPDPQFTAAIGEKLDIAVGVDKDRLLCALGNDAVKALKDGIDQMKNVGSKDVPPVQIVVSVKPVARFFADFGDNDEAKASLMMMVGLLEMAGNKDHVTLTVKPMTNGASMRLELEEGLLKIFGTMTKMMFPAPAGAKP